MIWTCWTWWTRWTWEPGSIWDHLNKFYFISRILQQTVSLFKIKHNVKFIFGAVITTNEVHFHQDLVCHHFEILDIGPLYHPRWSLPLSKKSSSLWSFHWRKQLAYDLPKVPWSKVPRPFKLYLRLFHQSRLLSQIIHLIAAKEIVHKQ